jgi:Na+/melibiose symporter-like transporter
MIFELSIIIGIALAVMNMIYSELHDIGIEWGWVWTRFLGLVILTLFGYFIAIVINFPSSKELLDISKTSELWFGCFFCVITQPITFLLSQLVILIKCKISERHLWNLQKRIRQLNRAIAEKKERKELEAKLKGRVKHYVDTDLY